MFTTMMKYPSLTAAMAMGVAVAQESTLAVRRELHPWQCNH